MRIDVACPVLSYEASHVNSDSMIPMATERRATLRPEGSSSSVRTIASMARAIGSKPSPVYRNGLRKEDIMALVKVRHQRGAASMSDDEGGMSDQEMDAEQYEPEDVEENLAPSLPTARDDEPNPDAHIARHA
jgi:hypothetical protein